MLVVSTDLPPTNVLTYLVFGSPSHMTVANIEDGFLEPVWSCGPILPPSLIDLIEKVEEEDKEENEIGCDELILDDDDYDDAY